VNSNPLISENLSAKHLKSRLCVPVSFVLNILPKTGEGYPHVDIHDHPPYFKNSVSLRQHHHGHHHAHGALAAVSDVAK
jgi:hypothetical protein